MERHGSERHYLRADGVYITSVLEPTLNFDPVRDTAQVAARFVAPSGLAGVVGTVHLMGPGVNLLGRPGINLLGPGINLLGRPGINLLGAAPTLKQRWDAFKARVKLNIQTRRLMRGLAAKPAALPAGVVNAGAARPPAPSPTALPAQGSWAPEPQSMATAAISSAQLHREGPPTAGAVATAISMAPGEAAWPMQFWQNSIVRSYPGVVGSRAETDALAQWFGNRTPTTGSGF